MINKLINVIQNIINNDPTKYYDHIVIDISNINYINDDNEPLNNFYQIMSVLSYIIKPGGNIIIINNFNLFDNTDLCNILNEKLLWKNNQTIIVKSKIIDDKLPKEYISLLCYSNNYRITDPESTLNKIENVTNLWLDIIDNKQLYERIIKVFSNENDIIFDPCMYNESFDNICKKLNRNYIGIKYNE